MNTFIIKVRDIYLGGLLLLILRTQSGQREVQSDFSDVIIRILSLGLRALFLLL